MQIIWNEQNNEKLFAINETALYNHIKRKSGSVNHIITVFEWIMVVSNLIAALLLLVDAIREGGPNYQFFISAVYLGYMLYGVFLHNRRRRQEVHFAETMVGELEKAIWQINHHIRQARTIGLWYVLPLTIIISVSFILNGNVLWALAFFLVFVPVSLFGTRWEINKWYIPKKQELEALRQTLLAEEKIVSK